MPDKIPSAALFTGLRPSAARTSEQVHPGFYDGIFNCYDAANTFLTLGLHKRWRRAAARAALRSRPVRILDVCCGTGELAMELRRLSRGSAEVTGLDFSEAMLSKARMKSPGISFLAGKAGRLPFPDAAFDALTVSFAARNLAAEGAELGSYFREFLRVLKPGGVFVNLETSRPGNFLIRYAFHLLVRLLTGLVGLLSPGHKTAYAFLAGTIASFHSPEKLSVIISAAGFSKVEFRPLMFGALAVHKAVK